ncbi:hypothetical protein DFH09DRAFT_1364471 [Mycena vulgaris]|nr:hypothetical protein DFH09DRAFT_1364471 [Mycena vulgaris]
MFFSKSLLAAAAAIFLRGTGVSAFAGEATVGFTGTTFCGCSATVGPFMVSIPATDIGTHVCCEETITVSHNGKSIVVLIVGIYNGGAGTNDIQLGPGAFDLLADFVGEILLDVIWAFE